jgi:hypothetical protein
MFHLNRLHSSVYSMGSEIFTNYNFRTLLSANRDVCKIQVSPKYSLILQTFENFESLQRKSLQNIDRKFLSVNLNYIILRCIFSKDHRLYVL